MNEKFTPKNATDEDWTMSDPKTNLPPNQMLVEPIEDWSMTGNLVPPQQKTSGEWKMPEPKFRVTSGSLPQDFVQKRSDFADLDTQPLSFNENNNHSALAEETNPEIISQIQPDSSAAIGQPAAILPVEPQPDITEAFSSAQIEVAAPPEEKSRSKAMQLFLAFFGITAMFLFAVAFLVIIYFLFFWKTGTE